MSHVTDYPSRDSARLVYLSWLSRVQEKLIHRPTPCGRPFSEPALPKLTKAAIRKNILASI